jgi:hypothetical protein
MVQGRVQGGIVVVMVIAIQGCHGHDHRSSRTEAVEGEELFRRFSKKNTRGTGRFSQK